jgi:hypothetical protein
MKLRLLKHKTGKLRPRILLNPSNTPHSAFPAVPCESDRVDIEMLVPSSANSLSPSAGGIRIRLSSAFRMLLFRFIECASSTLSTIPPLDSSPPLLQTRRQRNLVEFLARNYNRFVFYILVRNTSSFVFGSMTPPHRFIVVRKIVLHSILKRRYSSDVQAFACIFN